MSPYMVQLCNVSKRFGDFLAVENMNLNVQQGEFLTLLGPSGCGKTTTLRMIAGFEQPTDGKIFINGMEVNGVPPYRRDVNTVFQSYALFPHMNVFDNIAFGLKMKKFSKHEIKRRVMDALKLVQLEEYGERKPDQLSGGQKQRIAIARALVNNPKVLLLDEPLGALDLKLRKQMQVELKHLQQKLGITFIYVTHDQEEALTMSDRIAVMNKGVIEQIGTPDEIYDRPVSRFVADFIGETNLFEGKVVGFNGVYAYMELSGSKIPIPKVGLRENEKVWMAVRPEKAKIVLAPEPHLPAIQGKFVERIYAGSFTRTVVAIAEGKTIVVNEAADTMLPLVPGSEVYVSWEPEKAVVIKG
ncbi:polyamine ABC transporter ATP-binding protein [Bacillaceae bacterium]